MVAETNARTDGPTNSNSSRPNLRNKSVESGSREADYFAPSHPAELVTRSDFRTKVNQF